VPGSLRCTVFCCVLLVHSVGQAFGHNQLDHFLGSDFDGSASRRVTASTGRTLGHFQLADAWQSDFAAVFQLVGNDLAQLVQSARAVVFGASIASAMSAISWSLVRAIVVFLPYQIHMDCRVQCQPSSPIFMAWHPGDNHEIGVIDAEIGVWFDLTDAECTLNAETWRKTGQN
jgi:hypothetical protein